MPIFHLTPTAIAVLILCNPAPAARAMVRWTGMHHGSATGAELVS